MGCFQCEQLFVWVEGDALAKPASHRWTGRRWRWVEGEWYGSNGPWLISPVGVAFLVIGGMLLAGVFGALQPRPGSQVFLALLGASSGLMLLLALVMLLSFRPWRE